jgi:hypothetical protein
VGTPVGELCLWCDEPIEASRAGVITPVGDLQGHCSERSEHYECFIRQIVGSVAHITMQCSCYIPGSLESDPPGKDEAFRGAIKAIRHGWHSTAENPEG